MLENGMINRIEITDPDDPQLRIYTELNEPQLKHYNEPAPGLFIAESPKVIERALDAGYAPVSVLAEDSQLTGEARSVIARCGDVPVYTAGHEIMRTITGYAMTRGMLCAMRRLPLPAPAAVCREAARIAVLEEVVNPTNIGAIIRSAAALGMDAVLLTKGSADPLQRRAIRVSMGTVFQIPWTFIPDVSAVRELGFAAAAMALSDESVSIDDPRLAGEEKLALVLGTEGEGLRASTIAGCDYTVRIPMKHGVDSLNVAAASAVAFWQLRR